MAKLIDLSHRLEAGMVTYKGLPAPIMCDFLSREESRGRYADGEEFAIQRIEMVGNTSTYLDSPFHRFADGTDLADLKLEQLAHLEALVVTPRFADALSILPGDFAGLDVAGKAILLHTGWDRHWRTDAYFGEHPYLTAEAADWLVENGAAIVGIDSCNIDNMHVRARPVHTMLLGAGIPICEHMTGLGSLPDEGFRFSAVPPKVKGMGTFPVRAYALLG